MIHDLDSLEKFQESIHNNEAVLIYFSHEQCNVCKVLKPKVKTMLDENYPKIKMYYADTVLHPEIAAQNSIFTVPTIVIYFDNREFLRVSRNVSIKELQEKVQRPYEMMFN